MNLICSRNHWCDYQLQRRCLTANEARPCLSPGFIFAHEEQDDITHEHVLKITYPLSMPYVVVLFLFHFCSWPRATNCSCSTDEARLERRI
jgi:hypothetical protein